jgi:hypothetical protein
LNDRRKAERAEQQSRALAAIRAVQAGADPTDEALRLANEYTDKHTLRLLSRFRRKRD